MRNIDEILAEMCAEIPHKTEKEESALYVIACLLALYEFQEGFFSVDALYVLQHSLKDVPAAVKFIPAPLFVEMEMNCEQLV